MTAPPQVEEPIWADAHNHLHDPRLAGLRDRDGVGDIPCLINATSEDDWQAVLDTAALAPDIRHAALGVHPWFAHLVRPGWEIRLRTHLKASAGLAIGECGLDGKSRSCPISTQLPVFETQLRLAREFDRPLTIHCVAAWEHLFDSLTREPPPPRWMVHGFSGSADTARRLIKMGAFLSIPTRALHPQGASLIHTFATLPPERILLETDAPNQPPPAEITTHPLPDTLHHPANIAAIGSALASHLDADPSKFARQTLLNFNSFIGRDFHHANP